MIIAVCGKKQVGKNTVATMLQYLFTTEKEQCISSFEDYEARKNNTEYFKRISDWEQKSFAYKVKQILSILTGIPVKDMEKEEVKLQLLDKSWSMVHVKALSTDNLVYGPFYSEKEAVDYINKHKIFKFELYNYPITVRKALQLIGTDLFRDKFSYDTWITALFIDYKPEKESIKDFYKKTSSYPNTTCVQTASKWIITDCRFPNEADAIKEKDGYLIKIERDLKYADEHMSETSVENINADFVINNNGSIQDLFDIVKNLIYPILKT